MNQHASLTATRQTDINTAPTDLNALLELLAQPHEDLSDKRTESARGSQSALTSLFTGKEPKLQFKGCLDVVSFQTSNAKGTATVVHKETRYTNHATERKRLHKLAARSLRIKYIEIALDIYGPKKEALDVLAAMIINHAALPAKMPARACKPFSRSGNGKVVTETIWPSTARQIRQLLDQGSTIYVGNQRPNKRYQNTISALSLRAYWKCTDGKKKGLATPLPPEEHRARIEICIQKEMMHEVGLHLIHDWASWEAWSFSNVTKLFAQRLPLANPPSYLPPRIGGWRDPKDPNRVKAYRQHAMKTSGKDAKPRKHATPADTRMNGLIRHALTRLDRQLRQETAQNLEKILSHQCHQSE